MDLKPGIYKATVRGVPDQIVMVEDRRGELWPCTTLATVCGQNVHAMRDVTDARPLIVLDLGTTGKAKETADFLREIEAHWRGKGWTAIHGGTWDLSNLAEQIETQVKPARIEEPQGIGAVVEAASPYFPERKQYVCTPGPRFNSWYSSDGSIGWDDLIDPVLVREGVS